MADRSQQLIWRWLIGSIIGTSIVAVSSPFFVRSYLPRTYDSVRQVLVLPSGNHYRWRSEGYADTFIGPHGMPGRYDIPIKDGNAIRLAIWGDSQAEGMCVDDEHKLHSQIERAAGDVTAFPLARSGDDATDWLRQMPRVEQLLAIDVHVLLVAERGDMIAAAESRNDAEEVLSMVRLAETLPAFVIEACRRLITDTNDQRRKLRFAVGPAQMNPPPPARLSKPHAIIDWEAAVRKLDEVTDQRIVIVYAPILPNITDGSVQTEDPHSIDFELMRDVATQFGFMVIDVRDAMRASAANGDWPHGFQNGRFGNGHLNRTGYRIIAKQVAEAFKHAAIRE